MIQMPSTNQRGTLGNFYFRQTTEKSTRCDKSVESLEPKESFYSSLKSGLYRDSYNGLCERLQKGESIAQVKKELADLHGPRKVAEDSLRAGLKASVQGGIFGALFSSALAVGGGAGAAFLVLGVATSLAIPIVGALPVAALAACIPALSLSQVPLFALSAAGVVGAVASAVCATGRILVKQADERALAKLEEQHPWEKSQNIS